MKQFFCFAKVFTLQVLFQIRLRGLTDWVREEKLGKGGITRADH